MFKENYIFWIMYLFGFSFIKKKKKVYVENINCIIYVDSFILK